jgi:DNA-binding NtrC family response regulator
MNTAPENGTAALQIMVVDDESLVTGYLQALLKSHGHQVTLFSDPLKALSHFEAAPDAIDLVISDQTMPGMSGVEMAQKMLARRPGLPIILCTGYSDTVSEGSARAAGIRAFLHKPYKSSKLLATIAALWSGAQS